MFRPLFYLRELRRAEGIGLEVQRLGSLGLAHSSLLFALGRGLRRLAVACFLKRLGASIDTIESLQCNYQRLRSFVKPIRASAAVRPNNQHKTNTRKDTSSHRITHTNTDPPLSSQNPYRNSLCVCCTVHRQEARRAPWRVSPAPQNVVNFRLSGLRAGFGL